MSKEGFRKEWWLHLHDGEQWVGHVNRSRGGLDDLFGYRSLDVFDVVVNRLRMKGAGTDAFEAVYETEDKLGNHGVRLSKEIVKVAGRAMEKNFTSMGPYVLPISEQYKVVRAMALRKVGFPWFVGCCGTVVLRSC